MDAITKIRRKAGAGLKTIVLPEYEDKRVVEAAEIINKEGIAKVLLLSPEKIDKEKKEKYIQDYYQIHIARGIQIEEVRKTFEGTLYYTAMMVREGLAGGIVVGASHTTPDVARACIRCIGIDGRLTVVSSCFIMVVPDCPYGEEGAFIFADCGIIPEPNVRQLCYIAISAAELAKKVLGLVPRVGFLSYSTRGSAKARSTEKITEAISMIKKTEPGLLVDGEMQVDAAIVPEVAKIKYPDSPLGGRANILIFPDLEAGNIGYKLTQRLAKARAIGPLVMGLNKPASDLSRGCSVEDIVDCVAVTAIRA